MAFDTDVLIVGAGPTGLMLAAQLQRFGIDFRIIDKVEDRMRESRAIVLHARSMELIQNLGLEEKFLERINTAREAQLNVNGKKIGQFNLSRFIDDKTTPYPSVFFIPQYDTENIFISHLAKNHIKVERPFELIKFTQYNAGVRAEVEDIYHQKIEKIHCRYLVACDGSKSAVRSILNIPFEGKTHEQEFLLADAELEKSWKSDMVQAFFHEGDFCIFFPLTEKITRVIGSSSDKDAEIDDLIFNSTIGQIQIKNLQWVSNFKVHHRNVSNYQSGRVFFAGDAAHIHSPLGGQGMNTGLQDASNLGWKLAFVLKGHSHESLLHTYHTERWPVGRKLVQVTDRIFSLVTSKNIILSKVRDYLIPNIFKLSSLFHFSGQSIFKFISQLHIKYHEGEISEEISDDADQNFMNAPHAGERAPDSKLEYGTLFELFQTAPCHLLVFGFGQTARENQFFQDLQRKYDSLLSIHFFEKSGETLSFFEKYGVLSEAIYFIRPDGYIGFKSFGADISPLKNYLKRLMGRNPKRPKKFHLHLVKEHSELSSRRVQ